MSTFDKFIAGGPWAGGVTSTSAVVKTSVAPDVTHVSLVARAGGHPQESDPWITAEWTSRNAFPNYDNIVYEYRLEGLQPGTRYYYALVLDGVVAETSRGTLQTFPEPGTRAGFKFAFGSCSRDPDDDVFVAISNEPKTLFFAHLGDLHYGNLGNKPYEKRFARYDEALGQTELSALFKRMPVAYMWDDHDFLGNNAGGASWNDDGDLVLRSGATTARDAYDAYVPHYPLVDRSAGVFQAFTVGRVRFLLADSRFGQTPYDHVPAGKRAAVFLQEQWDWLTHELRHDADVDLFVLVSTFPYIVPEPEDSGNWGDFANARRQLADEIKQLDRRNLCIISGDAHMLAIDDGSHSGFANGNLGGIPVFHAASLSSSTSVKGGVYSHGTEYKGGTPGKGVAGSGQFGIFEVTYTSANGAALNTPRVVWRGRRANGGSAKDVIWYEFNAANPWANF
jgi:phosphodiesterase/alkaline phosphatase D-like protein